MRFRMEFKHPPEAMTLVETCWWVLAAWQADADEAWQDYVEGLT